MPINLSDQAPPEVPHVHLDLYAGDRVAWQSEVEPLVGLGATKLDWPWYRQARGGFVALAGPDGNRFCVTGSG